MLQKCLKFVNADEFSLDLSSLFHTVLSPFLPTIQFHYNKPEQEKET